MAAMVNRGVLNFLNQLDEGKRSRRNSFAERVANFLTPNDEFEYRGGLLTNMDGTSAMDRIGEKTSYGTLGQANFAGNDPITSFPNQMPQGTMARGADATGGQIVRSLILPVDVMQTIAASDFADKQGFVQYLEDRYNNFPDAYNMSISRPDGLNQLYHAYEAIKLGQRALG